MGILPRRNPAALIAYYLGIFSLVPYAGLALVPPALVLGVFGLRAARRNPEAKGGGHAWTGIVLAVVATVVWGGALLDWFERARVSPLPLAQGDMPEPRMPGQTTGRQRSRLVRAIALGTGMAILLGSPILLFGVGNGSAVSLLMLMLLCWVALGGRGPSRMRMRP